MRKINVGIIGYGVVGKGTVQTLIDNAETIKLKTGQDIIVKSIADLSIDRCGDKYSKLVPVVTKNADDLINDPEIDVIVELIGGYGAAKTLILKAFKHGKHVVTANKALLAVHGKELFDAAVENNVTISFEASVGGGIPIVRVMKEDFAANNIQQIYAILNGTSNYILTRMTKEGKEFDDILKDAQRLGYAEADPTFDVEGIDTAHKITLLSSIAFSHLVDFKDVYVEGITNIKPVDIDIAKELGCTIKLLAIAKSYGDSIEVRVHPTMVRNSNMLALVDGVFNAICVTGDKVGTTMHYGRGAGSEATGSAVVADIIAVAKQIVYEPKINTPLPLGFVGAGKENLKVRDIKDIKSSFYIRMMVQDKAGVLAKVASILAENDISISSAIQRELDPETKAVPLVFMSHETFGGNVMKAIEEIDALDIIRDKTVVMRVED